MWQYVNKQETTGIEAYLSTCVAQDCAPAKVSPLFGSHWSMEAMTLPYMVAKSVEARRNANATKNAAAEGMIIMLGKVLSSLNVFSTTSICTELLAPLLRWDRFILLSRDSSTSPCAPGNSSFRLSDDREQRRAPSTMENCFANGRSFPASACWKNCCTSSVVHKCGSFPGTPRP